MSGRIDATCHLVASLPALLADLLDSLLVRRPESRNAGMYSGPTPSQPGYRAREAKLGKPLRLAVIDGVRLLLGYETIRLCIVLESEARLRKGLDLESHKSISDLRHRRKDMPTVDTYSMRHVVMARDRARMVDV